MTAFNIARDESPEAIVLRLTGDLDMAVSPALREQLHDAFDKRPKRVIVDMKGVTMMDSSGIAVLIEALRFCRKQKMALALSEPSAPVRHVLELARLAEGVFEILDRTP